MTDSTASDLQDQPQDTLSPICPVCTGTGVVNVTEYKECALCEGTGNIQGAPCPSCHGTAAVYEVESEHACPTCKGTAFV